MQQTHAHSEDLLEKQKWQRLLKKYMIVYLLATLSDWLQGPYVYALYSDYGYEQHDIAVLFVAGFGSSMIFGSFVGGMADWGGRRAFVVLYAITYAASCFTKHFKDYWILMIGRLLGGIATSLLFSVFEAWLIRSHSDAGLKSWLGKSFSWAAYGNSVIAILAGLLAEKAVAVYELKPIYSDSEVYFGGSLAPFDLSMGFLILCGVCAMMFWEENYGETDEYEQAKTDSASWYGGLKSAFDTTVRNQEILLCGLISSLYEGSMYVFVFYWTPALKAGLYEGGELPFGLIFSTFMVSCMTGSSFFSIQIETIKNEKLGIYVFLVAALSMLIIATFQENTAKFIAMSFFEMTVGMYFPIMGTMKGMIVPEAKRAAIYNLYRIPLNFIVLASLLTDLTPNIAYGLNAIMLLAATFMQYLLMKRREKIQSDGEPSNDVSMQSPLVNDAKDGNGHAGEV